MKRFGLFILLAVLSVTVQLILTPPPPATAASCVEAHLSYTNTTGSDQTIYATVWDSNLNKIVASSRLVVTLGPDESFDGTVQRNVSDGDGYVFLFSFGPVDEANPQFFATGEISSCGIFGDARLNNTDRDAFAPAAVYENETDETYEIYAIDLGTGQGQKVLILPFEQINDAVDAAISGGENLLIEEGYGISIYALTAGTCQMNAFRPAGLYEFEWMCKSDEVEDEG